MSSPRLWVLLLVLVSALAGFTGGRLLAPTAAPEPDRALFADYADDVRSVLATPLRHEGSVVGTLTAYDKMSPDRLSAGCFTEDDLQHFVKFASHLEREFEH